MAEVEVARDGAVQIITLNRPDVLNAFNRALHAGLRDALRQARDVEVRAVVVTGAGRGFCAGQDLTEFGETPDIGDALRATYHPNVLAIRALEKPVIAAVNGVCVGARLGGRRDGRAARAGGGARRALRGSADSRDRDDEAALRPRRHGDARGAARAGGPASGCGHPEQRLPGGRGGLSREAAAELQRPVAPFRVSP